jgi:hypothetical protein
MELLLTFFQPKRVGDHPMVLGLGGIKSKGELELMESVRWNRTKESGLRPRSSRS